MPTFIVYFYIALSCTVWCIVFRRITLYVDAIWSYGHTIEIKAYLLYTTALFSALKLAPKGYFTVDYMKLNAMSSHDVLTNVSD